MLWISAVFSLPALGLLSLLFFQLKSIEIATQDTEAELRLGRQRKERLEVETAEAVADAPPAPEASASPAAPS